MNTLLLEEMTWLEIESAMESGMRTVIIPCGAIEQHGPHLPESTDTLRGYIEGAALAERLGDALVAPVIRPGLSEHHMVFKGTVALRPEIFAGVLEDYIASYVKHGFEKIVICCPHGGNMSAVAKVVEAQRGKYPNIKFATDGLAEDIMRMLIEFERAENMPLGVCGGHADDFETSVLLAKLPDEVRTEKLSQGYMGEQTLNILEKIFKFGLDSVTENGVLGDPTSADPERGKRYFNAFMDRQEALIRKQLD